MRSEVTSRSNWANDNSTFSVSRPIEVVVLNCWVTDTKDTWYRSPAQDDHQQPTDLCGQFTADSAYHGGDARESPGNLLKRRSRQVGLPHFIVLGEAHNL